MKILVAPIAGVTDYPYRLILKKFMPDYLFTEMVSANAIVQGNQKTIEELLHIEDSPSVQLFGADETIMLAAAQYIESRGIKHLDINMGCPMKKIIQNGYGSALLGNISQAEKIINAIKKGTNLELSIKIRIGYQNFKNPMEFVKLASDYDLKFVTIHGRTREQLYSGVANWDTIKAIKAQAKIPIIGNGDIFTAEDAIEKQRFSGVDGVMIARGMFGNPWLLGQIRDLSLGKAYEVPTVKEKIAMALEHIENIKRYKGERAALFESRKHLCWYFKGLRHATDIKNAINHAATLEEVLSIIQTNCD